MVFIPAGDGADSGFTPWSTGTGPSLRCHSAVPANLGACHTGPIAPSTAPKSAGPITDFSCSATSLWPGTRRCTIFPFRRSLHHPPNRVWHHSTKSGHPPRMRTNHHLFYSWYCSPRRAIAIPRDRHTTVAIITSIVTTVAMAIYHRRAWWSRGFRVSSPIYRSRCKLNKAAIRLAILFPPLLVVGKSDYEPFNHPPRCSSDLQRLDVLTELGTMIFCDCPQTSGRPVYSRTIGNWECSR